MICFLDLDNVITDFDQAVRDLGADAGLGPNATEDAKLRMYKAINEAGESFWENMPWLSEGKKLWQLVKPYKPTLLSAPGEFNGAEAGKQAWVLREMPGTSLFLDNEKWRYAERGAILIDDMPDNISAWQERGGVGILHKNFEETKQKLEEALKMPSVKITLADMVRRLVAFVSLTNLKDYLQKSVSVLAEDNPMKSIITQEILNNKTLTKESLKLTLKKLKGVIKSYALEDRRPFQVTILEPIQGVFDEKIYFNPTVFNSTIRNQKDILNKKEKELSQSKKTIKDVSTIPFPSVLTNGSSYLR